MGINIDISDLESTSVTVLRRLAMFLQDVASDKEVFRKQDERTHQQKNGVLNPAVEECCDPVNSIIEPGESRDFDESGVDIAKLAEEPLRESAAEVFKISTALIELDAEGYLWDSRIHSRTKSKTADNRWKLARGVDQDLVAKVRTEHVVQTTCKPVSEIPEMAPPPPPPFPVYTAVPGPSFASVMAKITQAVTDGRLKKEVLHGIITSHGLPSLPQLAARPDLFVSVNQSLDEVLL